MSAEKLRPARVRARLVYDWMGRYPRKGADWSPEEDQALLREYESGRYFTKEIAARHLREPVAIERRLDLLRKRAHDSRFIETRVPLDKLAAIRPERNWQTERETAQQAITKIKGLFASSMWPDGRSEPPKPGAIVFGKVVTGPRYYDDYGFCTAIPLTDLPPEIAQALQFGGES